MYICFFVNILQIFLLVKYSYTGSTELEATMRDFLQLPMDVIAATIGIVYQGRNKRYC